MDSAHCTSKDEWAPPGTLFDSIENRRGASPNDSPQYEVQNLMNHIGDISVALDKSQEPMAERMLSMASPNAKEGESAYP